MSNSEMPASHHEGDMAVDRPAKPRRVTGRAYGGLAPEDRAAARRARFIEAGIELFGTQGFRAATVRGVCAAAGLTDRTPEGFTNSIEQDSDPSPADMAAVLDLINGRQVSVLVVNEQTLTGASRQVRDAALAAGVPTVSVTETLPAGTDYLSWQSGTTDRLAAALRESR